MTQNILHVVGFIGNRPSTEAGRTLHLHFLASAPHLGLRRQLVHLPGLAPENPEVQRGGRKQEPRRQNLPSFRRGRHQVQEDAQHANAHRDVAVRRRPDQPPQVPRGPGGVRPWNPAIFRGPRRGRKIKEIHKLRHQARRCGPCPQSC